MAKHIHPSLYHGGLGGSGKNRQTFKKSAAITFVVKYEINAEDNHSEAGAERKLAKMLAAIKKGAELTGLNYPTCSNFNRHFEPGSFALIKVDVEKEQHGPET